LFLSPYEVLYFYEYKKEGDVFHEGIPIDILPEIKHLGDSIKKAIEFFSKKTGRIPRLTIFSAYPDIPVDVFSYVKSKVECDLFIMILKNIKNCAPKQKWFTTLGKDINTITIEILREGIIINLNNMKDIPEEKRQDEIRRIRKGGDFYITTYAIYYSLLEKDNLNKLITREVEKLYNKLLTLD